MDVPAYVESAFSQLLGCRLQRLETGVAEVALALEPQLRNRGQKLHGGAIFSLVDIAMGLACSSQPWLSTSRASTIECKINYIRAVSDGEVLCTARVLHAGRRTLVVDADVSRATSWWPKRKEPSRFSSSLAYLRYFRQLRWQLLEQTRRQPGDNASSSYPCRPSSHPHIGATDA
jgi:acyl-CoA thioesterase